MIQRKQTLFLLLAAILAIVCFFLRLFHWIDVLLVLSTVLSAYTIFLYRRRIMQARLCLAGMFILLAWYVGVAALEGEASIVESLPMVSVILIFMARKGILDDEKLVRAADRIR